MQRDDADRLLLICWIAKTLLYLLYDGLRLGLVNNPRVAALYITSWDMTRHNRSQATGSILPKRDQGLRLVAKAIRELNDFRHAAEMFAEPDPAREADLCLFKETIIDAQAISMRQIPNESIPKRVHSASIDTNVFWTDLLIVADHHNFLRDIEEKQRFGAGLARFIDNHNIEHSGSRLDRFGHPIYRHYPSRNRRATVFEVFPSFSPILWSIFPRTFTNFPDC